MILDENSNRIILGDAVDSPGGEGTAYAVVGRSDLVAKIYHTPPDRDKCEKLEFQVSSPLPLIRKLAAWPQGRLYEDGKTVGFLMQKMPGKKIHLFYRPADRKEYFRDATTWQSLIDVARNVAAGFHCLHRHGVTMGDVNESNVFVTQTTGEIRFIDCDSFDIQDANGHVYPCHAGTPGWMAPELLESSAHIPRRTEQHDLFGLAVMIFHLLFMGRHPFAGVPPDKLLENPPMPEDLIKHADFPYERGRGGSYKPPPNFLTLKDLPDSLACLFERAFLTRKRPSAYEWYKTLQQFVLKKCQWGHVFSSHLNECPWCRIWKKGGHNFFVVTPVSGVADTSLEKIEILLASVRSGVFPIAQSVMQNIANKNAYTFSVPSFSSLIFPTLRANSFPTIPKQRNAFSVGIIIIVVCILMAFAAPSAFFVWSIGCFVGVLLVAPGSANPDYNREIDKRKNLPSKNAADIEKVLRSMQQLSVISKTTFDEEKKRAMQRVTSKFESRKRIYDGNISRIIDELIKLKNNAQCIPGLRNTLRGEIAKNAQLEVFLSKYRLPRQGIPQIGEVRYNTLIAHGIQTAWDVRNMRGVPSLGAGATELKYWVRNLEAGFRFDSTAPLSPAAEQEIQRILKSKQIEVHRSYEELSQRWISLKNSASNRLDIMSVNQALIYEVQKLDAMTEKTKASYSEMKRKLDDLTIAYAQSMADAESCPQCI